MAGVLVRIVPLIAGFLVAASMVGVVQLSRAPPQVSSGVPEATSTPTQTPTPTPTSNRPPPQVDIDMTANGQQGPITVTTGDSVTYHWVVVASVGPPGTLRMIFVTINDDTYDQLDGSCSPYIGNCEGTAVVTLSTPGSITNTVVAEASAYPPGYPICCSQDQDSVTVVVVHPTPKNPDGDTDGDTISNSSDPDDDNDGCTDVMELGANPSQGGLRNPHFFWDFYDTPDSGNVRDKVVTVTGDILRVAQRFGANDAGGTALINRNSDPLAGPPPAAPAYHPAFDRGPLIGPDLWDSGPPDGTISVTADVLQAATQFGHSCL